MNTGVLYLAELWILLDICPGVGFAGSYDNCIFSLLRKFCSVLRSSYTNLHSTNSVGEFPFLHGLSKYLLFVNFLMMSIQPFWLVWPILTGIKVPHGSFDFHFSNSDVECLYICLMVIGMSSLEKCLFRSSHVLIGLFFFKKF